MAIGNSVNDEIRAQQKKAMEELSTWGKIKYLVYYYKWHAFATVAIIVLLTTLIYDIVTQKDSALRVVYINAFPNVENEEFMQPFAEQLAINPDKEEVTLDTSFYINMDPEQQTTYDQQNIEKVFVQAAAGAIDVCVVDESYFLDMIEGGFLLDLSTVLTDEQMEKYKDLAFYYNSESNEANVEELVGIEVTDFAKIVSTESYPSSKAYYCIIVNSEHVDNSLKFLDYLETP